MGWLDWSFDQAMRADCCAIIFGYEAKVAYLIATGVLKAIDDEDEPIEELRPGMLRRAKFGA